MIIKDLYVKNFRSLRDSYTTFDRLTALVGPNGAGKSSLLKAFDLFFTPVAKYEKDDFYEGRTDSPIEITITFGELSDEENSAFSNYVHNDELKVIKVMEYPSRKDTQSYHGLRLLNKDFLIAKRASNAEELKKEYVTLKMKYKELPEARTKSQIIEALEQWEKDHVDRCNLMRDEHQFFGYKEVGEGKIQQYIKFLLIPAVREASQDATESRGSILNDLMEITIRKVLSESGNLKRLEEETKKQYIEALKMKEIGTLESGLSQIISGYAPGVGVKIKWNSDNIDMLSLFKTSAFLVEDGYESPVSFSGHGSQRAFVMALLQYIAMSEPGQSRVPQNQFPVQSLVLAIEEPEIYQHPTRQRHLMNAIKYLSSNGISSLFSKVQVLYATHSPLFVQIDDFGSARRLCKSKVEEGFAKQSIVSWSSLEDVAKRLSNATEGQSSDFSEESLRPRLHAIMTPWMNEGFFADAVVLVEGEEDRAALLGQAALMNVDLDGKGISVVPCNGKSNIDRPLVIFDSLKIPVYPIWDNDKRSRERNIKTNHLLLKLLDQEVEDFPSIIGDKFSCFENNIGEVLSNEIGSDLFKELLSKYKLYYGLKNAQQAEKNSIVIKNILIEAKEKGIESNSLKQIVERIVGLIDNR